MKQNQVFRRLLSLAAALALLLSLGCIPCLAAEEEAEIEIVWLSGATSEYQYFIYIQELGWVWCVTDSEIGYAVYDVSTGARIEEFDAVGVFSEGLALVAKEDTDGNEKCGFIDKTGKIVVPLEYDNVRPFSEGLALVVKEDADGYEKYGFIDKSGKVVVPLEYDYAESFSEGLAAVAKRNADGYLANWGKYGFIDKTGKVVIPMEYDYAESFSEGLAAVAKKDADGTWRKYGFIDRTGKVVVPLEYGIAEPFSEGLALVRKTDADGKLKFGFIDKTGKVVVSLEYDNAPSFFEGLAEVAKEGKHGFIDTSGKLVIPMEYDDAASFSEGLARVGKRDADGYEKYGFVDTSGKLVVPMEYDYAEPFSERLALVMKNRKFGFIDKSGKLVVPLEYDYADSFFEGLARVMKKDGEGNWRCGFIEESGKVVIPLEFDDEGYVTNDSGFTIGYLIDDVGYITSYDLANYSNYITLHDKITELRWVKRGLSYGVFKNPYHVPSVSSGEANEPSEGKTQVKSEVNVSISGMAVKWTDAAPFIDENSRTMVPLRAVAESLGLTVSWDGVKREASFTNGKQTIYFPIGSSIARTSSGETVQMDTAAVIKNDRTYAPIRYLAEYFGFSVEWDGGSRTVLIS